MISIAKSRDLKERRRDVGRAREPVAGISAFHQFDCLRIIRYIQLPTDFRGQKFFGAMDIILPHSNRERQ
jgi:hypothetical protein